MAKIDVRVGGIEELARRLSNISSRLPVEMGNVVEQSVELLHEGLSFYTQDVPPKPEGSAYVRTFALQESIGREHGEASGRAFSGLDYAPDVMGEASQIPLHQGRWWTQQDIADELFPTIEELAVYTVTKLVEDTK